MLQKLIDELNNKIAQINEISSPKLNLDLVKSSKNKSDRKVRYTKNYQLPVDGVHPNSHLNRLWLYRLLKFKNRSESSVQDNQDNNSPNL